MPRIVRTMSWTQGLGLAAVLAIVLGIFLAAPLLAGNMRIGCLSNHTVHKLGHIAVWGSLSIVLALALGRGAWAGGAMLACSSAAEVHQLFVPGRYFSLHDLAINALAITGSLLLLTLIQRLGQSVRPAFALPRTAS